MKEAEKIQPMLDKALAVGCLARGLSQLLFPDRQRTDLTAPDFNNDKSNREEMQDSEPEISHPQPMQQSADNREQQTADDETDETNMRNQYDIGERAVRSHHRICGRRFC